jgi:hypothetical protein
MRVLFLIDAATRPASPPYDLVRTISPPVIEQPLMSGIYFLLYVTTHQLDYIQEIVSAYQDVISPFFRYFSVLNYDNPFGSCYRRQPMSGENDSDVLFMDN